jgi:DNA-binding FadR family transcriptional regulator
MTRKTERNVEGATPLGDFSESRAALVRTQRIPERIAANIRKRILRGEMQEGASVPPESELMRMYGVSRPTLREALRILEAEQLLLIRRGGIGGAVVQRPSLDVAARQFGFVLQDQAVTIGDVHRARSVVEPPALAALALTVTPTQLADLNAQLIDVNQHIGDPPRYSRAAEELREKMVMMTGQATLTLLMRLLREVIQRHTTAVGRHPPDRWPKLQRLSLKSHQRLLDLIGAGDAAAAEEHWREHLAQVEHHLGRAAATQVIDLLD